VSQNDLNTPALIVLTALNLLNYADRNVCCGAATGAGEFHVSKIGLLTSAFLGFYMIAAPFVGPLADRYSRDSSSCWERFSGADSRSSRQ
jgi:MFS family permease